MQYKNTIKLTQSMIKNNIAVELKVWVWDCTRGPASTVPNAHPKGMIHLSKSQNRSNYELKNLMKNAEVILLSN